MQKPNIFFPGDSPLINRRTVLYFEQHEHPLLNKILQKHYLSLKDHCEKHGFTFIYLPGTRDLEDGALERLANQLQYLYPRYFNLREKGLYMLVKMLFEHYPGRRIYTRMQELLGDMNYPEAGFLIFDEEMTLLGKPQYRSLDYAWIEKTATEQADPETWLHKRLLNFFINELSPVRIRQKNLNEFLFPPHMMMEEAISSPSLRMPPSPEDRFMEEAARVAAELRQKLSTMLEPGQEALILNMLTDFIETLKKDNPKAAYLLENQLGIKLETKRQTLSPLKLVQISGGYDFRITLPDYDLEIPLTPLCKTLYLFFLRHEEGVKLKDLADHQESLMKIYARISNLSDQDTIRDNITRLTDVVMDNSIHVNCARIKSAFSEKMTDEIAKHYYITGGRGLPKKIILNRKLIDIDPFLLAW